MAEYRDLRSGFSLGFAFLLGWPTGCSASAIVTVCVRSNQRHLVMSGRQAVYPPPWSGWLVLRQGRLLTSHAILHQQGRGSTRYQVRAGGPHVVFISMHQGGWRNILSRPAASQQGRTMFPQGCWMKANGQATSSRFSRVQLITTQSNATRVFKLLTSLDGG